MLKKQIIIAAAIFLAIAVIGIGIYYFSYGKVKDNTKVQAGIQPQTTGKSILPLVKKLSCDYITGAKEKADCQAGVIQILNSENNSACAGLASKADKSTCRQAYVIKEAAVSGDLNKCKQAISEAMVKSCTTQASYSLAIQKKDKKYCENIVYPDYKESCLKALFSMGVK